ncbi:RICIN domain-containing protein [Metabacillus sp. YM-086]|uniref:RICIN domain-containing protein n=1 Tax=Metabacillus sp. YM-086 TaxID=3341729 RepID=UPI003A88C5D0
MKRKIIQLCIITSMLFIVQLSISNNKKVEASPITDFVYRDGKNLMLNGEVFKYSGPNIYWLGLDENTGDTQSYPTAFRVNDVLDTAVEMGATVVRSHSLGASVGIKNGYSLTLKPEKNSPLNEEALRRIDYAIAAAKERGLRMIIPLVDNWDYYHGGKKTWVRWYGYDGKDQYGNDYPVEWDKFYTDINIINGYKQYISDLLNHTNVYTGIKLKDEPAILAWQIGNELETETDMFQEKQNWYQGIANHIRSIDSNHLISAGSRFGVDWPAVKVNEIDIIDAHYYPPNVDELNAHALDVTNAGKAFVIGEYSWNTGTVDNLEDWLYKIRSDSNISGDSYWSLFGHNDQYGYVQHNDGFTLHYPGTSEDMKERAQKLREHAFWIDGRAIPSHGVPSTPVLTSNNNGTITWRGATFASNYIIQRSTSPYGPWTNVCNCSPTDLDTPWVDPTYPGGKVYYRIKGVNLFGVEGNWSLDVSAGYKLINRNSGLVLDVPGSSTQNNIQLQQWNDNGVLAQQFTFGLVEEGFEMKNASNWKSIEVENYYRHSNANIIQNEDLNKISQRWIIQDLRNGYYSIRNVWSNKAMEVSGGGLSEGIGIVQSDFNEGLNQQWQVIRQW